jgi:Fe2+ transport system protein B
MASSALSVIIYALILKWAARDQSATDYAVLCGSSRLLTTLILMAVPPALKYLSWGVFYALCIATLALLAVLMRREVQSLEEPAL